MLFCVFIVNNIPQKNVTTNTKKTVIAYNIFSFSLVSSFLLNFINVLYNYKITKAIKTANTTIICLHKKANKKLNFSFYTKI
jgi:hypothetical protein